MLLRMLRGLFAGTRPPAPAATAAPAPVVPISAMPVADLRREADAMAAVGQLDEALLRYRTWADREPDSAEAWLGAGNVELDRWAMSAAIAAFRRAHECAPMSPGILSGVLFYSHYVRPVDGAALHALHRSYGAMLRRTHPPLPAKILEPDPARRLRIGYVSPNFSRHSVGYFIAPVIAQHDRQQFEVFCYHTHALSDDTTARIRQSADHWSDAAQWSDATLEARIREDRIDVLVDLSGHCKGNRLPVFARKPAPVQLTWLGYPDTTGLDTIDLRITDAVCDPVLEADARHTERLCRIEGTFLAYEPPEDAPEVAVRPAGAPVVFGSFSHAAKIDDATITLWARILDRVPGSRLVLKSAPLGHPVARERMLACFARHGIGAARVSLEPFRADRASHLAHYGAIDIALDTFPYNGTTTTCEALWMGVPVVTRMGGVHMARVGASLLRCVGLDELVATSDARYVDLAAALAGDPVRCASLRAGMRDRLRRSVLLDHAGFTRKLERACREAWKQALAWPPGR
jgi:predicted O-linked N-acetylglucosamine transferase (SPINDLY family)